MIPVEVGNKNRPEFGWAEAKGLGLKLCSFATIEKEGTAVVI